MHQQDTKCKLGGSHRPLDQKDPKSNCYAHFQCVVLKGTTQYYLSTTLHAVT